MQKITYINSPEEFIYKASKKIKQTDIVLDIGCGIQPQKYIKPILHICAEPYEKYAQYLTEKIGNKGDFFLVLKQKWNEVIATIPEGGVDTVIALDVIEHLNKQEGLEVLKKTIALARKQVVIFTPYGFLPQEVPEGMKDAWGLDGSEWQRHKSGWTESDFDHHWDIYVCPEFHFSDAITGEIFEKPYGAMFAILDKNQSYTRNIYSFVRMIKYYLLPSVFIKKIIFLGVYVSNRTNLYKYISPLWRKYILKKY